MATSRRKKISTLGTIAILLGGAAWAATRTSVLPAAAIIAGTVGLVMATLAMLSSLLIGNTGRLVPLVGWITCAAAIGYSATHNPNGSQLLDQFKEVMAAYRPTAPAPAKPSSVVPSAPPAAEDPVGKGTIFDMSQGGKDSPRNPTPVAPARVSPAVPAAVIVPSSAPPATTAMQRYTAAMNAVTRAHTQVDKATAAVVSGLVQLPAYEAAKQELESADSALHAVLANNGISGSPELVATEQRYLNAKAAVRKLIKAASDSDVASITAKQVLTDAQNELKAAKEDLTLAAPASRQK
jgi:hypothetical protein